MTEKEKKIAIAQMQASGQVFTGEGEEYVKNWIRMLRVSVLLREYPAIKILGMMNIRAAAGTQTVQYQCMPELFTNPYNQEHSHLCISRMNREFGTHIRLQLPNDDAPYHRVTQRTQWNILANPQGEHHRQGADGPVPLATVELLWTMGCDLNDPSAPLHYDYLMRRLKIDKATKRTDRLMLLHIFEEAKKRYQALASANMGEASGSSHT